MQYELAYSFLISKLEKELPTWLSYHNVANTKYGIESAEYIANKENVAADGIILLKTAALFHDAGFLENHNDHERISCKLAKQYLPNYEYSEEQIDLVCSMIMATKLPQTPANELGKILCDADLFYIGSELYAVNAEKMFLEFKRNGLVKTKAEWLVKQADFLSSHNYFTETARMEKDAQKKIILQEIKSTIRTEHGHSHKPTLAENIQDACFITFGIIIASFALKEFLVPNHFFDGGVTGISLLVHELYHFNLGLVIVAFNLPLIVISYFSVGKSFAVKTFVSVILLGVCLLLIPDYALTNDKLLISIFGGVFLGIGIGLVMRAGAALDGIEVLALYTLKKTSFTISEIILGINIFIFTIAALKFGIETALSSILTYFSSTRSIS